MYVNISNCYHCNLFYMVNHYVRGCRVTTPPSPEIDSHGDIS